MRSAIPVALVALLTACAASPGSRHPGRDQLTGEQIRATEALNLYDAIHRLRPQWLGSRGPTSASDPTPTFAHVAVNGTVAGDIDYLRNLNSQEIELVRFLAPGEAAARYGMGHPRGVIDATLRRR